MAKTKFNIKGEVEIHYDGKVYHHHNNLSNEAKKIICNCLGAKPEFSPNKIRVEYYVDADDSPTYSGSQISQRTLQNNDTELKLTSLFDLGHGSTFKITNLYLENWQEDTPIQFSSCDLSLEDPPVVSSSPTISINWIIKPQ